MQALPNLKEQMMAMLSSGDREAQLAAGFHSSSVSLEHMPGYFDIVRPIIAGIIARLEDPSVPAEPLRREARVAIRLAWPAIHHTTLPKAQMQAFYDAVVKRSEGDDDFRNLQHDVKLLAELVNG